MYILEKDKTSALSAQSLSNAEYLALQIWQLETVFVNEIGAIKNSNLEYIALSDSYVDEFELNSDIHADEISISCNMKKVFTAEIKAQEQLIITNQEYQDSVFIFQKKNVGARSYYLCRKRPIINPSTRDVVGIFIIAIKSEIGAFRKQYMKHLLGWSRADMVVKEPSLTEQQRQIVLCLLFGLHSRKEIAAILSDMNNSQINETRIKNILSNLYEKFSCSSSTQLIQLIMKSQMKLEIPMDSVEEGNYPV